MPHRVAVVPHTHWDREWYAPFQTFRSRLVETLDAVIEALEGDPGYRCFLLDGQMALVDDYLEVRPEAEARLRRLALAGRVTVGPWYVLMDEFLVSGETIVRNLQKGLARAAAFGGAMDVGYLPDMFGHVGQMPQILALAGLPQAVVWRGVPSAVRATAFWWEAPDGSAVRAEYLPVGYGNGASLPLDPAALVRRARHHREEIGPFLLDGLLYMNGSDHLGPQPGLPQTLQAANELQDDLAFEITSLPDYLADAPTVGLPRLAGELRSGARANVLMGVTSNRVDVRRAAARAERALERRAEPFAALFMAAGRWPERLLGIAWHNMVLNSAHDSICACSVDAVVDAVLLRAAEADQIARAVADQALEALARSLAPTGPVVVNASARTRSGTVEVLAPATIPAGPGEQVISTRGELPDTLTLDAGALRTVLAAVEGTKLGDDTWIQQVAMKEDDSGIDLTVTVGTDEQADLAVTAIRQDLLARLRARPEAVVRVTLTGEPVRRVAVRSGAVAGLGWRALSPQPLAAPVTVVGPPIGSTSRSSGGASHAGGPAPATLANGMVSVGVDPVAGTFSLDGVPGFGRLVDGGDVGDAYNYSPPADDRAIDRPTAVAVSVLEPGPVRGRVRIVSSFEWPDRVEGPSQSRVGVRPVEVTTVLELHADERLVRVTTSFVNPSRDHRLRVHLPLPSPAESSRAESAFGVEERGLHAEGRPEERALATFPSRGFVQAGGLTVVHDGVVEYELVDLHQHDGVERAGQMALTALRATGMLSGVGMRYRPMPAGPVLAVEGLQLVGKPIELRYGLATGEGNPWELAEDLVLPLEVVTGRGTGARPGSGSALQVEGAQVSSVRREGPAIEVRVHNPTPATTTVRVGPDAGGWLVDLRGRPLGSFEGSFELRPYGIATFRLPRP
ncbi:MAG TPA: glycoside hydrolase family 38 C-terminal domain-containing protein [Acidimicrobiales bacterium]|jgi:hypothetical protein